MRMGGLRTALLLVAAAQVCFSVEHDSLVTDLSDLRETGIDASTGGDDTHPANTIAHPENVGPGYFQDVANFVGPKYGLPGYKESHNWEIGIDVFSPSVFNQKYFAVKYHSADPLDEEDLKKDWLDKLTTNVSGGCPKGRIDWDLNEYAIKNPSAGTVKDENYNDTAATCMQILEHFLSAGIYEGLEGFTGFKIDKHGDPLNLRQFPVVAASSDLTANDDPPLRPVLTYTYTFWLKVEGVVAEESNIMAYVTADFSETPVLSLSLKPGSTDLVYNVAQSNAPDYPCEALGTEFSTAMPGYLTLGQWYFISLVAEKYHTTSSKMILYVDGAVACQRENTEGTTIDPQDNAKLFVSTRSPPSPANAVMDQMNFYPGRAISPAELDNQMEDEGSKYTTPSP